MANNLMIRSNYTITAYFPMHYYTWLLAFQVVTRPRTVQLLTPASHPTRPLKSEQPNTENKSNSVRLATINRSAPETYSRDAFSR
jgi:hypothetical protein